MKTELDGRTEWRLGGKLHREDGPAVEDAYGYKEWYLNGKRHREDGPAIEYTDGSKAWFIDGKELSHEEFIAYVRQKKLGCLV